MKYCPQCRSSYTDESLAFCTLDGTPLLFQNSGAAPTEPFGEPETIISQGGGRAQDQMRIEFGKALPQAGPPGTMGSYQPPPESKGPKTLIVVLATIFGTLLIFGIAGIAGWLYLSGRSGPVAQNPRANNPANSNSSPQANTNAEPSPTPSATPTPKPTLKPAEVAKVKQDVESALLDWKDAAEGIDLEANLESYAETVDYYKGGKISRAKVKANKQPAYDTYDTISINLKDIKVVPDPSGDRATVTFDKDWNFESVDKYNRGEVQQQLVFSKVNGKWKITSEKDLKVYFADKGKNDEEGDY